MRRGEIWVTNLNPGRGSEVGKVRPVLLLQADWLALPSSGTVLVVPLTSRVDPRLEPLHPTLAPREGLRQASQALCDQLRALDRRKIGQGPLARIAPHELRAVERSVAAVLGMRVASE
jgi:mRNA interferase MazF